MGGTHVWNKETINELVSAYIKLHQEGECWDFKKEWYHSRTDLLHDILCMANLTTENDGLIIIGVDEKDDYSICGVNEDTNRKNTNNLVCFLRDKQFDGGIRPTVIVQTIAFGEKEVDVIVVKQSRNKPFYLIEGYEGVKPYHIYTRVGDSNTPINKSADRDKVEALWRSRFGIDKPILKRFGIYLRDPRHWTSIDGSQSWYYEYAPEFRIETEVDEDRNGYEYYCFCVGSHQRPSWEWIRLLYHSTKMYETLVVSLDGAHLQAVIPNKSQQIGAEQFCYYLADDINHLMHNFLANKRSHWMGDSYYYDKWNDLIPTLSTEEAATFFEWLNTQQFPLYEGKCGGFFPEIIKNGKYGGKDYIEQYWQAEQICKMLKKFRDEKRKEIYTFASS